MLYAGIDVGGTSVKIGVLDENGTLLHRTSVKSIVGDAPAMAQRIADALTDFKGQLTAAGVSCAGSVDLTRRTVDAGNLNWDDEPFADMLEQRLGCPVAIDNDVAGALMGEWKLGACRGEKNVFYITLGTGVGGGFLIEGRPFRGVNNYGGEVGHIITHADGLPCTCGGRGCLEQYASAPALVRMSGGVEPPEIFRRAEAGDAEMEAVLEAYVHELAIGIASMMAVFCPEMVVIGGGVSNAGEPLLRRITHHIRHKCPAVPGQPKPRIVLAQLGNMAGVIGGAVMAMELAGRA